MSKVSIFFATGHEEIEALTVVDLCRRAGVEVEMVSVTGEKHVTGSHGITTVADALIEDIIWDSEMIILPGGMPGTVNLENCELLMAHVDEYLKAGKKLAAICAAPTVYGKKGLLKGKKACCYPGMEDKLLEAQVSYDEVSVDGQFITSRGLGTAIAFSLAIIAELLDNKTADNLAKAIVYKQ